DKNYGFPTMFTTLTEREMVIPLMAKWSIHGTNSTQMYYGNCCGMKRIQRNAVTVMPQQ
ncbi:hypothetical protein STEG23_009557, partial [Scotinomys teguina]